MSNFSFLRRTKAKSSPSDEASTSFAMVTLCSGAGARTPHAAASTTSPLAMHQIQARLSLLRPTATNDDVQSVLVSMADSPYLASKDRNEATLPARVLFACGVAAPRFPDDYTVARWSSAERDEGIETVFAHLDDCRATSAAQAI